MNLYHYTKAVHLIRIVKDGYIKRATAFIGKNETPAVHLTYSPEWEPTVWSDSKGDINKIAGGKARIIVKDTIKVVTWDKFKYVSGTSTAFYDSLTKTAKERNSPIDQWRQYFGKITKENWLGIEIYNNDQWIRWDGIIPIEDFVKNKGNVVNE